MCIYLSSTFALFPQSSHKCILEKIPFYNKKIISGFWPATKIKSVRVGKHFWISIHRSFWKTLMCKLPSPKVNIHDDVSIRHVSCWSPPHPSLSSNVSLQFSFWNSGQSWLPRLFQIILKISFSTKFLLTWAACITSHCIWWLLQSKTLTFRQLENSASQLYQRHLLWFHIHFFIYIFDNRPF